MLKIIIENWQNQRNFRPLVDFLHGDSRHLHAHNKVIVICEKCAKLRRFDWLDWQTADRPNKDNHNII